MPRKKKNPDIIVEHGPPISRSGFGRDDFDRSITGADADSGDSAGSDSSHDRSRGTILFDSGAIDAAGDGSFDLPLGDDADIIARTAGNKSSGRKRARAGAGSRGDSARSDSGARPTETQQGPVGETVPRDVSFAALGKSKGAKSAKDAALTREFLAEGFGLLFQGLAVVFRDTEWKLPEDDAQELAERLHRWLESGGSKRVASFEKLIGQYQPLLMLIVGLSAVVAPRISHTRSMRRAVGPQTKAQNPGGATPAVPAAPVAENSSAVVGEIVRRNPVVTESALDFRQGKSSTASFRREDFADIS